MDAGVVEWRGGPLGVRQPRGAIRSMLEQYHALDCAASESIPDFRDEPLIPGLRPSNPGNRIVVLNDDFPTEVAPSAVVVTIEPRRWVSRRRDETEMRPAEGWRRHSTILAIDRA
jgi:hypothetical protein